MTDRRVVFDTNTLVSYFIVTESTPGRAVRKATGAAVLLASQATLDELAEVLSRRKFDAYAPIGERASFIKLIATIVELIPISGLIQACRDPKDDKFLEVAVNGAPTSSSPETKTCWRSTRFTAFASSRQRNISRRKRHHSNMTLPDWPLSMVWKPST